VNSTNKPIVVKKFTHIKTLFAEINAPYVNYNLMDDFEINQNIKGVIDERITCYKNKNNDHENNGPIYRTLNENDITDVNINTKMDPICVTGVSVIHNINIKMKNQEQEHTNIIKIPIYNQDKISADDIIKNINANNQEFIDKYHVGQIRTENERNIYSHLNDCYPYYPHIARCEVVNNMLTTLKYSYNLDFIMKKYNINIILGLEWCKQLAQTLLFFKMSNVVHGDIKPDNIMVTSNMDLKIIDLGGSVMLKENEIYLPATTIPFSAPELRNCIALENITYACDIFSFGHTIYNILTGKAIFFDKNLSDEEHKKLIDDLKDAYGTGKYEFPKDEVKKNLYKLGPKYIMKPLYKLIKNCTKKNPVERPSHYYIINALDKIYEHVINLAAL